MQYNFDIVTDRRNTCSVKWDGVEKTFHTKDILPMWIADMDFLVPQAVIEAIENRNEHGIFGYTCVPETYCDVISDWLYRRHQWEVQKDWMNCTPGVIPALSTAILAFTEPGDGIIVQSPVYPPFFSIIENNGRRLVDNPLLVDNGTCRMDFAHLEKAMQSGARAMLLCSPHNPVGRVWRRDELILLGELCSRFNVLIISDEIHSDIVFTGHRHIPIASLSEELAHNTITCMAASKTFGIAGLTTSTTIIPDSEKRGVFQKKLKSLGLGTANVFGITASEAAYRHGGEWLDEMLGYLQENLRLTEETFLRTIPGIKANRPEGTYLVWLDCRELGLGQEKLLKFMSYHAKVGLNDGTTFGPGGEGFLRMNIACPRSVLMEGLERIEAAVRSKNQTEGNTDFSNRIYQTRRASNPS